MLTTKKMSVAIPFYYNPSHHIKETAAEFYVEMVSSNDYRIADLTPLEAKQSARQKAHKSTVMLCHEGTA